MNEQKPLILVTNDDGCQAKGLRKLVDLMRPLGDVVVISTDRVMSAKGHSITTTPTLTAMLVDVGPGYKEYVCNGTPVDCVKIGYQWLLDKMPDLVVSGINHGSNASTNVIYSGTMAAAIEASMDGIDAIGFSLDCYDLEADFDHLDGYITAITKKGIDVSFKGTIQENKDNITGNYTGTATINPATGLLMKSNTKSTVAMTISQQGLTIPTTISGNTTVTVTEN